MIFSNRLQKSMGSLLFFDKTIIACIVIRKGSEKCKKEESIIYKVVDIFKIPAYNINKNRNVLLHQR